MTVLLLVSSAQNSQNVWFVSMHYLVFKDRLFAFACCEQTLIIPKSIPLSTTILLFCVLKFNRAVAPLRLPRKRATNPHNLNSNTPTKKQSPLIHGLDQRRFVSLIPRFRRMMSRCSMTPS